MPIVTPEELSSVKIDYLIVGGGTSGLTLAARLSEDPQINVLVVESGSHHGHTPEIDVPGYMGRNIANPKLDWTFFTVPQKRANGRAVLQPRGKGLGGSSLLNFLGMFRPSKVEMDALEELGNKGWNWDSILHYMKKSETLQPSDLSDDEAVRFAAKPEPHYHGTNGPIKKSYLTVWYEMHAKLLDTMENMGVPRNSETGGGRNEGSMTSFISADADTAKRSYAYSAYLEPNIDRKNLFVLTDTHVTKVVLEGDGDLQRATGILAVRNEKEISIGGVRRGVVVAAGTFQTPQVLELSGIGNPSILSQFGIKSVIDLPGVGENLQDHVGVSTIVEVETSDETADLFADPAVVQKHEDLYKQRKGFFSSVPAVAYIFLTADKLGNPDNVKSWKDHAHARSTEVLANTIPSLKSGLEKQYAIQQRLLDDKHEAHAELLQFAGRQPMPYAPPAEPGKKYTSLFCALTHPLSRGTVHIASADPLAAPAIDPNYFANEADLDLVVHVVQAALRAYRTAPLSEHVKRPIIPDQATLDKGEEGLREYVKANCGPVYHPVGTAAMMPRADGGVVDPSLKVYGTSNLRVVDVSILPMELSCHIQSIAYAIGEKAADIIKTEAKA